MNIPCDSPVEFYGAPIKADTIGNNENNKEEIFKIDDTIEQKKKKNSLTYGVDGRVFMNGKPKCVESPQKLWDELLRRTMIGQIRKGVSRMHPKKIPIIRFDDADVDQENDDCCMQQMTGKIILK